jgi:hypothetical protein
MKPFLLFLVCCLCAIGTHAIIRDTATPPVLHSLFDSKTQGFYMPDEQPAFGPRRVRTYTKKQHHQLNVGRAMSIAGGGAALLGGIMVYQASHARSQGIIDDSFNGLMEGFGMVLLVGGAIVLLIGLFLLGEASGTNTEA